MTDAAPARAPGGRGRLRLVLAVLALVVIAALALAWLNRRALAERALTGWLERKGIPAEAQVYAVGPGAFSARLRVGDPRRPDFAADRVDVRYRLGAAGMEVRAVTLRRPVVRASLRGGTLSFGRLDPLIEEFRRRPPRPDAARPLVTVDDGVLLLASDYGALRVTADARIEDNRLLALTARSAPARLRFGQTTLGLGVGSVDLATRGARTAVRIDAPVSVAAPQLRLDGARLLLTGEAPYPDMVRRRTDGGVVLDGRLVATRARAGDPTQGDLGLRDLDVRLAFRGRSAGWLTDLTVRGPASLQLSATRLEGPAAARDLRLAARTDDLAWTRNGGDRLAAALAVSGSLQSASAGALSLDGATFAAAGPLALSPAGLTFALDGQADARGRYAGLGAPTAADAGQMAALKRAAQAFRVQASGVRIAMGQGGLTYGLTRPLRLRSDSGGAAEVTDLPGESWRLRVAGGGLPRLEAVVRDFDPARGGTLALETDFAFGPVVGGRLQAAGRLGLGPAVTFTPAGCARLAAERLEFGENDAADVALQLCSAGGPLLRIADGGWRLDGRYQAAWATLAFLQARVSEASGLAAFTGSGATVSGSARIQDAQVSDIAPDRRFHPLRMSGQAALRRGAWRADLAFRTPAGVQVAAARLTHDMADGQGGVDIDTGRLVFAEGGLQPADLSPLASALGSPAAGEARFTGGFAWNPQVGISAGVLDIPRLDFQSPAGRVTGLSGKITLTSLAPLVAAPGQTLKAERVEALSGLTDVNAVFALQDEAIRISGGEAALGGGRVRIESLELPFRPDAPTRGVLLLEGVQLHDIVEASPFGDKVDFDAKVTGRVPFEAQGSRVRITGGELKAIEPGRLSIQRAALTGLQADGAIAAPGAPAVVPNQADTFTDFAYQAMENLAFDQMAASIQSRPDGRLGMLFHIRGRHDPPQKQQIRLSLRDLIQRRFLGKPLPLPSGTGVNLTLDTTLNLDDLLADYGEYQRLRSSGPVQR